MNRKLRIFNGKDTHILASVERAFGEHAGGKKACKRICAASSAFEQDGAI